MFPSRISVASLVQRLKDFALQQAAPVVMANATNAVFCPHNGTTHDGTFVCHWTGGPATRGTLNIFWLCISTLGICVWSAVHPGVPYPGSSRLRRLVDRVGMLLLGLFMPEMLVLAALFELREAMSLLEEVANAGVHTQFPWWMRLLKGSLRKNDVYSEENVGLHSLTHYPSPSPADKQPPISANQTQPVSAEKGRKYPWTLKHSFFAVMGGYYGPNSCFHREGHGCDHKQVTASVRLPLDDPMSIPDVSENDLGDRSKADGLAKLLLIWQLFAFLANCTARWNQGLPLSLLEITTISHCLCSLVTLVLWWYKPHSVGEVAIIGEAIVPETPPRLTWQSVVISALWGLIPRRTHIDLPRMLTILTIAAFYGLPHLLGLSVHFLSPAEELLWKIATFAVVGLPLSICILLWILEGDYRGWYFLPDVAESTLLALALLLAFLYPICSMFLVGESVRQVFALPEGSFHEPQLARYLPSFS